MDLQHIRDRRRPAYLKERVWQGRYPTATRTSHTWVGPSIAELKERGLFLKRYPTDSRVAPVAREKPSAFLLLDGMYEQVEKIIWANDCGY